MNREEEKKQGLGLGSTQPQKSDGDVLKKQVLSNRQQLLNNLSQNRPGTKHRLAAISEEDAKDMAGAATQKSASPESPSPAPDQPAQAALPTQPTQPTQPDEPVHSDEPVDDESSMPNAMKSIFETLERACAEANKALAHTDTKLHCQSPTSIQEKVSPQNGQSGRYMRGHVSLPNYSLVVDGTDKRISVFIVPSEFVLGFDPDAELFQPHLLVQGQKRDDKQSWYIGNSLISVVMLPDLSRQLLRNLIGVARGEIDPKQGFVAGAPASPSNQSGVHQTPPAQTNVQAASPMQPPGMAGQQATSQANVPAQSQAPPMPSPASPSPGLQRTSQANLPTSSSHQAAFQAVSQANVPAQNVHQPMDPGAQAVSQQSAPAQTSPASSSQVSAKPTFKSVSSSSSSESNQPSQTRSQRVKQMLHRAIEEPMVPPIALKIDPLKLVSKNLQTVNTLDKDINSLSNEIVKEANQPKQSQSARERLMNTQQFNTLSELIATGNAKKSSESEVVNNLSSGSWDQVKGTKKENLDNKVNSSGAWRTGANEQKANPNVLPKPPGLQKPPSLNTDNQPPAAQVNKAENKLPQPPGLQKPTYSIPTKDFSDTTSQSRSDSYNREVEGTMQELQPIESPRIPGNELTLPEAPVAEAPGQPAVQNQTPPVPEAPGQPAVQNQTPPVPEAPGQPAVQNQPPPVPEAPGQPAVQNQPPPVAEAPGQPAVQNQPPPVAEAPGHPEVQNQPPPVSEAPGQPAVQNQPPPVAEAPGQPEVQNQPPPVAEAPGQPAVQNQPLPVTEAQKQELANKSPTPVVEATNQELKKTEAPLQSPAPSFSAPIAPSDSPSKADIESTRPPRVSAVTSAKATGSAASATHQSPSSEKATESSPQSSKEQSIDWTSVPNTAPPEKMIEFPVPEASQNSMSEVEDSQPDTSPNYLDKNISTPEFTVSKPDIKTPPQASEAPPKIEPVKPIISGISKPRKTLSDLLLPEEDAGEILDTPMPGGDDEKSGSASHTIDEQKSETTSSISDKDSLTQTADLTPKVLGDEKLTIDATESEAKNVLSIPSTGKGFDQIVENTEKNIGDGCGQLLDYIDKALSSLKACGVEAMQDDKIDEVTKIMAHTKRLKDLKDKLSELKKEIN